MTRVAVAVWLIDLDTTLSHLASCTDDDRLAARRFRAASAADRWLAGRGALRAVLAATSGLAAPDLTFTIGRFGKPDLAGQTGIHFNMSRAGAFRSGSFQSGSFQSESFQSGSFQSDDGAVAVIAIADRPVGVDIERRDRFVRRPDRLAARLYSPERLVAWQTAGRPAAALLQEWTRTEAVLKATGTGVAGGTHDAPARLTAAGWRVDDLAIDGYVGAIAAEGSSWTVADPQWFPAAPHHG